MQLVFGCTRAQLSLYQYYVYYAYYACTMTIYNHPYYPYTMPVQCLLRLYYACTMSILYLLCLHYSTMPTMLVLCLIYLCYAYYACYTCTCTMPTILVLCLFKTTASRGNSYIGTCETSCSSTYLNLDLPYVPVWPGQSRNLRSCPGQLSESPGFSWSQLVTLVC